jgi:hypothetical protein
LGRRERWPCRRVLEERHDRALVEVLHDKGLLGFHKLSRAETQRVADAVKESGLPATLDQAICCRNYIKTNNDRINRGKIHAFIRGEDGCVLRPGPHQPHPPAHFALLPPLEASPYLRAWGDHCGTLGGCGVALVCRYVGRRGDIKRISQTLQVD